MVSVVEILEHLKAKAKPENLAGMSRYGIVTENRFGVSIPELRKMAKNTGKNHSLALGLWRTGNSDAMILASMIAEPENLTDAQMEECVKDVNSWDVCDQVCNNLFSKSPIAWKKVVDWSKREETFVKRAAFSMLSSLAVYDKKAPDNQFIEFFGVIEREASDDRNFVKKAVNWALRNIGKRNINLNKAAIKVAKELGQSGSKESRWIGSNALKELESCAVQQRLAKS